MLQAFTTATGHTFSNGKDLPRTNAGSKESGSGGSGSMSLEVVELSSADDESLTRFLDSLAQHSGSVLAYHYPFYRNMLEKIGVGRPIYLGVRRSGLLCGYLPVFLKQSAAGSVLCSLPFFGPNAGVLCAYEDRVGVHAALLEELLRLAKAVNALSCSVYTPFLFKEFALYASSFGEAVAVDKFTQYLDLQTVQWSGDIERKLRRAQRASVRVSCEITPERLRDFYEIYCQNCEDYGIPQKPWECIESLTSENLRGGFTQLYFAILEDKVIAGLLVLFSRVTASYYIPCSLEEHRSHQPGTLLVDRAVRDARSRGLKYFNWESSPGRDSGVYTFKKRWGALEESYRIYIKAFQSEEKIRQLGRDRITKEFPYYFVWPFDRL